MEVVYYAYLIWVHRNFSDFVIMPVFSASSLAVLFVSGLCSVSSVVHGSLGVLNVSARVNNGCCVAM